MPGTKEVPMNYPYQYTFVHKCKEDATIELYDDSTKVIDNAVSTAREKKNGG